MNVFFNAICQMGIFMVCAQAIVHFRPNGSYEKYLRMLVSVMILVQIFLPVARLFSGGVQQNMDEMVARMQRQIEESMEQAKSFSAASDELLDRMTLEEVKTRLNNIGETEPQEPQTSEAAGQPSENNQESEPSDVGTAEISVEPIKIEIGGE